MFVVISPIVALPVMVGVAIVGDVTLVYKEDGSNDYSMGYINPKYWRIYN